MKLALIIGIVAVAALILWMRRGSGQLARIEGPVSTWSIPDSWSVGHGDREVKPVFTRFNLGLRPVIGHASFKKQLGIAVPFNHPTASGLPESEESGALYSIEDEIRTRFTAANESLFAGVITTGNMREFVLYTSDEAAAVRKAEQLAKDVTSHKLQFVVHDDPDWTNYKLFAGLEP